VSPKLHGLRRLWRHPAPGGDEEVRVVAINTDKDALIGEVADVLVVADIMQVVPALIENLRAF
jgi:electron transfer flavoprotein alpha subunit